VPKLWTDSIEAHRRAVHEAVLDAAAALVAQHGLRGVTMSQIAEQAGIGRATLYKYFASVEAILTAWHERHVLGHLQQLAQLQHQPGPARERLAAVLETYALSSRHSHDPELAAPLHRGEHVAQAHQHLRELLGQLLAEGAREGTLRTDVPADELVSYCLQALTAATRASDEAAIRRLVTVILDGLRP
jgi:AcrR family transcriptional regulator